MKNTEMTKYERHIKELTKLLYELVPTIVDVVEAAAKRPDVQIPSVEDVVRGMLIGGAGAGYEPAVKHAVRCYRRSYAELKKWEAVGNDVPEKLRTETLILRQQEVREREHQLKLLSVEVLSVKVGDPVDHDMHAVNPRDLRKPDCFLDGGTIAEVISPAFRWRDDIGITVVEPADVIAFAEEKGETNRTPKSPVKKRRKTRAVKTPR